MDIKSPFGVSSGDTASRDRRRGSSLKIYKAATLASVALVAIPTSARAAVSEADFAKVVQEVTELRAQVRALKGGLNQQRDEGRKTSTKVTALSRRPVSVPVSEPAQRPGTIPFFATTDKKVQFGSLVITPGGFVEALGLYRTRNLTSDGFSNFGAIPFNNSNLAHVGEQRFSARGTRGALLVEAPISSSLIASAYGEFDFQGAGATSNLNQYSGYVPRLRNAYVALDEMSSGWHMLAGQNWSLITLNSKGITPRNEVAPPTIDYYFVPGLMNARIAQLRLVKDFNRKLWLALSLENPATAYSANCNSVVSNTSSAASATGASVPANAAAGIAGGTCLAAASSGYFGGSGANEQLSLNKVPDVFGKVAYEAAIGDRDIHLEATGIYRNITDFVNYGALNAVSGYTASTQHNTTGYGIEGGIVAPVIPERLDFQAQGAFGRGLGRYTNTGLPDAVVTGNGALKAVGTMDGYAGFVAHVTPSIDVYSFAGIEQANREYSAIGGTTMGYGAPGGINNYGCNAIGGTCQAQTQRVWQLTGGFWDKIYKGSFGEMRVGAQYSYTERDAFSATANANGIATVGAPSVAVKQDEHVIMTSMRFYPFQ